MHMYGVCFPSGSPSTGRPHVSEIALVNTGAVLFDLLLSLGLGEPRDPTHSNVLVERGWRRPAYDGLRNVSGKSIGKMMHLLVVFFPVYLQSCIRSAILFPFPALTASALPSACPLITMHTGAYNYVM